jgi:hypothetical protein
LRAARPPKLAGKEKILRAFAAQAGIASHEDAARWNATTVAAMKAHALLAAARVAFAEAGDDPAKRRAAGVEAKRVAARLRQMEKAAEASETLEAVREAAKAAANAAANATGTDVSDTSSRRRGLLQMDFEVMAIAEAEQMNRERAAMKERSDARRAEKDARAFDAVAHARSLARVGAFDWTSGDAVDALLANATWRGDVFLPIPACAMPRQRRDAPGFVRDALDRRLGRVALLRGPALLTKGQRAAMLSELDSSRTMLGHDLVRLPDGERMRESEVFFDPLVDNPEAALEEGEEEATLERAAAALDAVDYADAEETLVEEEESAWRKKLEGLKAFIAEYAETYGISDGNELGKK